MRLQHRFDRLSVRLQWLVRELEPDRLTVRLADGMPGKGASRDEQIASARLMVRALLRRKGF